MNSITIHPGVLSGAVQVPTSKSFAQRAILLSALMEGKSRLSDVEKSADVLAMLSVAQQLGATVLYLSNGDVEITGYGFPKKDCEIHCGESGLALRMLFPVCSVFEIKTTVTCEGSLRNRPVDFMSPSLQDMGAKISKKENGIYEIQGPIELKSLKVDGREGSQFISGLLMAYALKHAKDFSITVQNLVSEDYVRMTLDVIRHFGFSIEHPQKNIWFFPKQNEKLAPLNYKIEGDWSAAAMLLVAAALGGDGVNINGLNFFSRQPDKQILDVFKQAEIDFSIEKRSIQINASKPLAFTFDATDCPDLFPPLVALAAASEGVSEIKGVNRLYTKESNRFETLWQEFQKLGIKIWEQNNSLLISNQGALSEEPLDSHNDHRIAMALTIFVLSQKKSRTLMGYDCVKKSYPNFFSDLEKLGAKFNRNT